MKIEIEIPNDFPIGRLNSYLKGIVDGLLSVATSHSLHDHTPEGHDIYRTSGAQVAEQIISAVTKITKRKNQ